EIVEWPLVSITVDRQGSRVVGIDLRFHPDEHGTDTVRVSAPRTLRIEETPGGDALGLEIEDDHGQCTQLRFRGVTPPGLLLDGLAPAELF
ncbi:MAG: hypothetical protein ACRD1H_17965, partial [Vicinamibacterales bacterium]